MARAAPSPEASALRTARCGIGGISEAEDPLAGTMTSGGGALGGAAGSLAGRLMVSSEGDPLGGSKGDIREGVFHLIPLLPVAIPNAVR